MKVSLLDHTDEPELTVASAARLCYSKSTPTELKNGLTQKEAARLIRMIYELGHLSVFEHASFTFGVEGISRVASHQLVRHRIASYSQQSQRYVNISGSENFVVPKTIKESRLSDKVEEFLGRASELYEELLREGVPAEDARFILPQAVTTNIVVTMNARELHHFFQLRLCRRAQWEIREMAARMLFEVVKVAPTLFEKAGPSCYSRKRCSEGSMTCGKKIKSQEEIFIENGLHIDTGNQ
ncbi:MAG: FAD-dependent thymidylate synthase [Actinobacteria bacterium]|nr:FAD-dependent thymidylate synthase [Actinomycetota bacterium]